MGSINRAQLPSSAGGGGGGDKCFLVHSNIYLYCILSLIITKTPPPINIILLQRWFINSGTSVGTPSYALRRWWGFVKLCLNFPALWNLIKYVTESVSKLSWETQKINGIPSTINIGIRFCWIPIDMRVNLFALWPVLLWKPLNGSFTPDQVCNIHQFIPKSVSAINK